MRSRLRTTGHAVRDVLRDLPLPARLAMGAAKRALLPDRVWDNPHFRRQWDLLQQTQWWSRAELLAYQDEELRLLIQHSYENVPYYRRLFDDRRLRPDDVTSVEDLHKIPLLTRDDVRHNRELLVARNVDRLRLETISTGGSSGAPLIIYHDATTASRREAAFTLRQWSWAGYRAGDRLASVRGNQITRVGRDGQRRCWDYDSGENTVRLLGHDMSQEHLAEFVDVLLAFRPSYLYGYPSTLDLLARYLRQRGVTLRAEAVFCESEAVYPRQRQSIEEQFRCRLYAGYGHSERAVDAVQCELCRDYHVSMEYGILETLGLDNEPVTTAGALGRVAGTGFDTYCMPLIRYTTDDLAVVGEGICPCGRESTLVPAFRGRAQEFLVSRSGDVIPFGPVYASAPDSAPGVWERIDEISFAQEQPGRLEAEVVLLPGADDAQAADGVAESLYAWLDSREFDVEVRIVPRIERTGRGKWRLLRQTLPVSTESLDLEAAAEAWRQAAVRPPGGGASTPRSAS